MTASRALTGCFALRVPSINQKPLAQMKPFLCCPSARPLPPSCLVNALSNHRQYSAPATQTPQASSSASSPLPLHGITVISLEQAIAGPFCTRQLADLGARVIKVERPGVGDFARHYDTRVRGLSSHFVWTNRNKESLALDLKKPEDFDVLKQLLDKADVLVQNLAPGATARMGLSFDALKEKHPGLIVCDISGYGQDGPYMKKKAYDLLIQSEAGMLDVTGTKTDAAKVGISVADISAGMYAYSNILSSLFQRTRTGKGRRIDVSMLESMVEWMGFPMYYTFDGAPRPQPNGASHAAIFPYGPFAAGDGQSVMLGIQNEREWANFCTKVLEKPDVAVDERFITNALRVENSGILRGVIQDVFSRLTAAEIIERLEEAAIANAKVNTLKDVWDHGQLKARARWTEVETSKGPVPALIPPGCTNVSQVRMDGIPEVGAHNGSILKELGIKTSCI